MEYVTKKVTEFREVVEVYNSCMKRDFARNELRPLVSIRLSWKRNAYDVYFMTDGDMVLGYACFVRNGEDLLLDYLAIEKEHRDQGLGSVFLKQLTTCLTGSDLLVCEVENPESAVNENDRALRERRLQFYLRNGFNKTEVTSTVFGVDYCILAMQDDKAHPTEEVREIYSELGRSIVPLCFYKTQFKVY